MNVLHENFSNDTIWLVERTIVEAHKFKQIIQEYMKESRQKVNAEKLETVFINKSPEEKYVIFNTMGFKKGSFPCKYLGIHLEKIYEKHSNME